MTISAYHAPESVASQSAGVEQLAQALKLAEDRRHSAARALRSFDEAQNFSSHWTDEGDRARRPLFNEFVRAGKPIAELVNDLLVAYAAAGGR